MASIGRMVSASGVVLRAAAVLQLTPNNTHSALPTLSTRSRRNELPQIHFMSSLRAETLADESVKLETNSSLDNLGNLWNICLLKAYFWYLNVVNRQTGAVLICKIQCLSKWWLNQTIIIKPPRGEFFICFYW